MFLFMGDGTRRKEAWISLYVPIIWMVQTEKKPGSPSMYFFLDGTGQEEAWIFLYVFIYGGWYPRAEKKPVYSSMYLFIGDGTRREEA